MWRSARPLLAAAGHAAADPLPCGRQVADADAGFGGQQECVDEFERGARGDGHGVEQVRPAQAAPTSKPAVGQLGPVGPAIGVAWHGFPRRSIVLLLAAVSSSSCGAYTVFSSLRVYRTVLSVRSTRQNSLPSGSAMTMTAPSS
jgi:hypothetical protein